MHTSCYPKLASTIVVHWRGSKSYEITPTEFVVWPPPCTEGNKTRGGSARSLIVKTVGSGPGEACWKAYQRPTLRGEGSWLSMELPDRELGPCEGLQRGLGGSLHASRYLGKNIGVIDGVCISTSSLSFAFTLLPSLIVYFHRLVDRIGT